MTANKQSRGWLLAPAAIFVLALGLRLVYLGNIRDIGFFEQPVSDGYVYDQRARGIAAGDWLGPVDFVHAPLYAYLLGLIKIVGGESLWLPRVVQTLGGASACVLLFLACRRLFDLHVAGVAAIWLALYPPAIFFDGLIQKAGLTLLLSTLLLWLVVRSTYQPVWWGWGIVGLVLGLLILTRQNMLALAPLIIAWLWFGLRARPRLQRLQWAGLAALGVVLTLFPWALRNRVVTGEWVLTTPNLGQNFAMGNHPEATGTYLPHKRGRSSAEHEQAEWVKAAEKACDRPLSAREVSDYYFAAAAEWIKANPGAWLRLTLIKCSLVWGAYELPDTEDYYLYQEWSLLLRTLDRVLHFGVLCPLAAAGVVLTCQEWRRLWFLYGWLLLTTLAVAAFVVFARYRFPLVPVLLIFAAAGLVESIRLVLHYASLDGWHGCVSRVQVAGIHGRHGRATHQRNVDRALVHLTTLLYIIGRRRKTHQDVRGCRRVVQC
ncbi:MAG: glycosyltransferase family 39 protein [Phycisphaerae bacterium]|nr:glycosyltransferase family 39 protein [Phycisphaerae bacterium]